MKLVGQYAVTREILFFKNPAEKEAQRLVSDLFLLSDKVLYEVEANGYDKPQLPII